MVKVERSNWTTDKLARCVREKLANAGAEHTMMATLSSTALENSVIRLIQIGLNLRGVTHLQRERMVEIHVWSTAVLISILSIKEAILAPIPLDKPLDISFLNIG